MMHRRPLAVFLLLAIGIVTVSALDNAWMSEFKRRTRLQRNTLGGGGTGNTVDDSEAGGRLSKPEALVASFKKPVVDVNGKTIPDYSVIYEFDQLVDHTNPSLGTFKQRYFHTWEFYKPGGPIILYTPGEQTITDPNAVPGADLTNTTMEGGIAQVTNGAVISLEHRFYGESQPHPDNSTSDRFKLHTIAQAIDDFVYFAQNVKLAMPGGKGEGVRPDKTPWVFVGGSYSGALASWIPQQRPGVFWATYSSSGVVNLQLDFWQYYSPIQKFMPANCSADVMGAIGLIDAIYDSGNATQIAALQTQFGLQALTPVDFLYSLTQPLDWQTLDISGTNGAMIYPFCDALEVKPTGEVAPTAGWGADYALTTWGSYYTDGFINSTCNGTDVVTCFALDGSILVESPVEDDNRAWIWMVCNELGFLQVGPPNGGGIVSKHYRPDAWPKYCSDAFPGSNFTTSVADFQARVDKASALYLGWNTTAERVFVVNGQRDPWVQVTLSADAAHIASTSTRPINLGDGFHCSDLSIANTVDPVIADIWRQALTMLPQWLDTFQPNNATSSNSAVGIDVGSAGTMAGVVLALVSAVLLA